MQSEAFEVLFSGSHSLILPEKDVSSFLKAGHKRVKVKVLFEGKTAEYHAALQKRGEDHCIVFNKKLQHSLDVFPNDMIEVQLSEDLTPYGVEMPEELQAVLQSDEDANAIFEGFTDGKKRSIIYLILRFKNSQTRIDKSILLCENLKKGINKPAELLKTW
ncbi:MAG: YdeI/OmpD-associated family protein [Muriicola sp.]|nr:YdeI/OmpD-associated family protein [Muriicola sp.]